MYKKIITLMLFSQLLASNLCYSVETAKAPDKKNPVEQKTTESQKDAAPVQGGVVTNKVMSMDECIQMALLNNPSIISAMSDKDIYKSQIAQAWSDYFPKLGLGIGYNRNSMLMANIKVPNKEYDMYQMPVLSAEQLVYNFGKTRAKTDIAKKTYEASESNLQSTINTTVYDVKEAYFNLLYTLQQEQIYADTVVNYEIHLKQAKAYYDIGVKAKIDVITAQYNLQSAKLNHIKVKHNIELSYAKLNHAMGLPEHLSYSIEEKVNLDKYNLNFEELISKAYETRPELAASKKKAEAAKILISASKAAFLPDINLAGNYTAGGSRPGDDYGYQFGVAMQYKMTNLYLLKKQVDEANATYKKDLADFEKARQYTYLEVKSAHINYLNSVESIPVAKSSMTRAKEQYDLASGRYKAGLGDAIELKDAETTYRNAQLEYYNSLLSYNTSMAYLEKVVGSKLESSGGKLL